MDRIKNVLSWIKLSRKYTFALLGLSFSLGVLCLVHKLGFPESIAKCAIISCEIVVLVITITYLTGQAKIDIQAVYGANKPPNPFFPPGAGGGIVNVQEALEKLKGRS